jgi:hypothetical protein
MQIPWLTGCVAQTKLKEVQTSHTNQTNFCKENIDIVDKNNFFNTIK